VKPALAFVAPPVAPAAPGSRNDLEPCHPPRRPVARHSGRHRQKRACPFAMIAVADLLVRIPRLPGAPATPSTTLSPPVFLASHPTNAATSSPTQAMGRTKIIPL
jgi:hypothetical protein